MIRVFIGDDVRLDCVNVNENMTLRALLDAQIVDYSSRVITMYGSNITHSDLDRTFAYFGYNGIPGHDKCYLLCFSQDLAKKSSTNSEPYGVPFIWRVVRMTILVATFIGLDLNSAPWYMYPAVVSVALSWWVNNKTRLW